MQTGIQTQPLAVPPIPEVQLSTSDCILAHIIATQQERWPADPTEDPIWGLLRMVMAQQISTRVACQIAEGFKVAYPEIITPSPAVIIDLSYMRSLGLPQRRAECCAEIVRKSDEIRESVRQGKTWEEALSGIKGIGPWTLAVFRIMVLREADELPKGDVGLLRAISNVYGPSADIEEISEKWRPYRSVACWYLWKTLGNEQLG
jgi:DNA-3-methyladenine glycosylase II